MRVGILCPTYPPNRYLCGVGDFTRQLTRELVRAGVEAVVLTGSGYRGPRRSAGAEVVPLAHRWTLPALARAARAARARKAHVLLVQYAPDLYPPGGRAMLFLPLLMRLLSPGIPVVLSMHTVGVRKWGSMLGAAFLAATSHAVLSTNEEVTHLLGRYLPPLLRKTCEIPIGANVEPPAGGEEARAAARRRVREECGLAPAGSVLAHFGFFYPGKGVESLLDAARRWKEEGRSFRLFMIGGGREEDAGYLEGLRARAVANGLAEEVVWTGYVDEGRASELLLAADAFLVPYEGGISSRRGSLMAGLAHGLPVVSTPPRIPTKYFREGENFLAAPAGDAAALAQKAAALMDDPALRERLRRGAAALAAEFAWSAIAGRTREFLLSVLEGRPLGERRGRPRS